MADVKPRVGIIGAGMIGRAILQDLQMSGAAVVDYIVVSERNSTNTIPNFAGTVFVDAGEALSRSVDLVIEAAAPEVLAQVAPKALRSSAICGFSCTALADPVLQDAVIAVSKNSGFQFHVPHGAVLALDGIADGREEIEQIIVTTTKSGKSLGVSETADSILFEGTTREACRLFPRNINVHAAVALAGIGFDRTVSRVVAVPGQKTMDHRLQVDGRGFSWDIHVGSRSLGRVSGAYTPRSAVGSVRRILNGGGEL